MALSLVVGECCLDTSSPFTCVVSLCNLLSFAICSFKCWSLGFCLDVLVVA